MTATLRVSDKLIDTTAARNALLAKVTTATVDGPRGARLRTLLGELGEVAADFAMAERFDPRTTPAWLTELACEERDVWAHIVETITVSTTGEPSDRP